MIQHIVTFVFFPLLPPVIAQTLGLSSSHSLPYPYPSLTATQHSRCPYASSRANKNGSRFYRCRRVAFMPLCAARPSSAPPYTRRSPHSSHPLATTCIYWYNHWRYALRKGGEPHASKTRPHFRHHRRHTHPSAVSVDCTLLPLRDPVPLRRSGLQAFRAIFLLGRHPTQHHRRRRLNRQLPEPQKTASFRNTDDCIWVADAFDRLPLCCAEVCFSAGSLHPPTATDCSGNA